MKFAGYKRAKTESEAKEASATLRFSLESTGDYLAFFAWDLTMGQKGFLRVIRAAQSGRVRGVVIHELKDLGRDLVSLVKTLNELLVRDVEIRSVGEELCIAQPVTGGELNAESKIVLALLKAHTAYSNDNRKIGIAAAKAAGASVGRPAGIGLDDAQEVIDRLTEQNDGASPSVRRLAKELDCSTGKAASLLTQWKTVESRREAGA